MQSVGRHCLIDIRGNDRETLDCFCSLEQQEDLLRSMAREAGATLLQINGHHFGDGMGLTSIAMLAESHISVHTWPEHGYAAYDIFLCGADAEEKIKKTLNYLGKYYHNAEINSQLIIR